MKNFLTRRKFFCALAASVIAVGAPLPIGFPRKIVSFDVDEFVIALYTSDGNTNKFKHSYKGKINFIEYNKFIEFKEE